MGSYDSKGRKEPQPSSISRSENGCFFSQSLLFIAIALFGLLVAAQNSLAVSASPHAIHELQPDGTEIVLFVRGNEHFNWQEDANGFTVLKNRGRFVYAELDARGRLVPTAWEVGKVNPGAKGLQKRILPDRRLIEPQKAGGSSAGAEAPQAIAPAGTIKNLVVMVRFSDHVGRPLPSAADMGVLFNATAPHATLAPTGSVKMVYLENSYGQMTLESTISNWVTVSNTEAYYADGQSGTSKLWEALREALSILDATTDFSSFDTDGDGYIDSITFIHSGYGAEWGGTDAYGTYYTSRIWSHRWAIQPAWISAEGVRVFDYHISPGVWGTSGSQIGRIGVIAHETGHFFGLPDLYDTDGTGEGIGSYGLMANSWGFDGSQKYPPHFSPWSKIRLGWLTPVIITQAGNYSLPAVETSPTVFKITAGYPAGEYLLVENRQPTGFDGAMPQGGLAIWHIDDLKTSYNDEGYPGQANWPNNGKHYRVALLQADGQYEMERGIDRGDRYDVYHAGGVAKIGPTTLPNTDAYQSGNVYPTGHILSAISASGPTMSFTFNPQDIPGAPPLAPSSLRVTSVSQSSIDLAWDDLSDNESGFELERKPAGALESVWALTATPATNSTSTSDTGLAADTGYDYRIRAQNSAGPSGYSNVVTGTTTAPPPLPDDAYAGSEQTLFGAVSGSYDDTRQPLFEEVLSEEVTGGAPSKRTSRLEHIWQFEPVKGGASVTFQADLYHQSAGDGDRIDIFYKRPSDPALVYLLTAKTSSDHSYQVAELPSGTSGSIEIKAMDSNRFRGAQSADSLHVRHMFIHSSGTTTLTPPSNLSASAVSTTEILLSWSDATGETIYRIDRKDGGIWVTQGTATSGAVSYLADGLQPDTSYTFQVCAIGADSTEACSAEVTQSTLPAGAGDIQLTTLGYKVKGLQKVDLSWSGATGSLVQILRNGAPLGSPTANDGSYLDNIDAKGAGIYEYQVCEEGLLVCSNLSLVIF